MMKILTSIIKDELLEKKGIELSMLRLDLIHQEISGNKWFKLKLNIEESKKNGSKTILTFGGAYSNHLHATAYICKQNNLDCIGIIRGEKPACLNNTLQDCKKWGMNLEFVSREEYRLKSNIEYLNNLQSLYGPCYIIPEGGNNLLGIKGCADIVEYIEDMHNIICLPVGSTATLAGILSKINLEKNVIAFSALKGADYLNEELFSSLRQLENYSRNFEINYNYHFGGFAKYNNELIDFIKLFRNSQKIELDFIYTAKMMYGIYDLIKNNYFKTGSKIIAIHTGGLQGNRSVSDKLFNVK